MLQEGLQQLLKGRTSFIIAHRLSTIKIAIKFSILMVVVLEEGSHDQLMAKHALYHHLYQSQYDLLKLDDKTRKFLLNLSLFSVS